jgi:hypothetical protein
MSSPPLLMQHEIPHSALAQHPQAASREGASRAATARTGTSKTNLLAHAFNWISPVVCPWNLPRILRIVIIPVK